VFQPNTFSCGQHTIVITDVNDPVVDVETSVAHAIFVANGFLIQHNIHLQQQKM